MIAAKPEIEGSPAYVAPLEGRRGLLRLDFNENTVGPSPRVLEAIQALGPEAYATYPEYAGLEARYAEAVSVPSDCVALFNGADAAIRAVFDAFGSSGDTFLTTAPTFGYYGPCAAQQGMRAVALPYEGPDLTFPTEGFVEHLTRSGQRPKVAFICNPNNPTGTLLPAADVLAFARAAPDTLIVVDEIYATFTGVSVLPAALELDNVLVLRSLSKTHGLAALRVGFAIGQRRLLDSLCAVTGPYDINAFGVIAAQAALDDHKHMVAYVAEVKRAKAWTVAALRERQVRVHAAGGNYVLVWPHADADRDAALRVVAGLQEAGILVRSMAGKPLIDGSFRLSIGTCAQMRRFMTAFDGVL